MVGGTNAADPIPDLQPFSIDPLILGRIDRLGLRPPIFTAITVVVVTIFVSWLTAISNLFYRTPTLPPIGQDLLLFVFRQSGTARDGSVPFLRDYPSIILIITVTTSICLVYGLFQSAAELHSDMKKSGCVKYTANGRDALTKAIDEVNARLARQGRFAPIALTLSVVFVVTVNFRLQSSLFGFLRSGHLYNDWWASLHPLRPGGILWVVLGAIGIYVVYSEAVLGLNYVRFLKKCKGDYQFKANMLNPDGLYGWARLRKIVSNLEIGVVSTLLSAWAMSFFLQPAIGSVITAAVLVLFVGIVMYVFIQVTVNFRRQVREDKKSQRLEIEADIIASSSANSDATSLLRVLVSYQRLDLVSKIPSTPIRQRWLVAGALSIIGPLSAIVVQLIKYFTVQ